MQEDVTRGTQGGQKDKFLNKRTLSMHISIHTLCRGSTRSMYYVCVCERERDDEPQVEETVVCAPAVYY